MQRYFMELAYDGKPFSGWQIQPSEPSVQEEINKALTLILRRETRVVGCGRTDTEVNASFFVAQFETDITTIDTEHLCYKLNRLLSKEIAIFKIYPVSMDMHARFSATSRTYKYYIDKRKNPFTWRYAYRPYPLPDINAMNRACEIMMEYEDFTSFSKLHSAAITNICHITYAKWEDTGNQLVFTITANRFLRNMVRAIVGTMLQIGKGRIKPEDMRTIIESKDRCSAGTSVPGNALFLCDIKY
ncbi:MAG: tRNA pseudouridine(38-40) synthase TruA [Marinifilaceae bacterium]